jgi:glyoxylase-like metal-dependent hydrolase (beta-lactamase superfamily II)
MQEIEQGIFIENSFPGVTVGALVLPHGTILIDAPLRIEDVRSWRATLINQGSTMNRLLVNLDAHPDRTLGVRALESTIIAHQKTAQVFRSRPSVFKGQAMDTGAEWETYNDAVGTRWAIPDITFNTRIELHWGPPDVILEHHPGSAQGAIWVIVPESKVIFVGDCVVLNQPPFLTHADIPTWIESLELLIASYRDFTIISGRGGAATIEAVRFQHKSLKSILRGMDRLSRRNASPEAAEGLATKLIAEMSFSSHLEEQYVQRLRHGLSQYYARHYRSTDGSSISRQPENET